MSPVCSEATSHSNGRHPHASTSRNSPRSPDATAASTAQATQQLDAAKLLQTLLLVQQEFQAEQSQMQQQLATLAQQTRAKDAQIAVLQASVDEAKAAGAVREECMREMERERVEWLDVLMCVKAMHGEMVDKMAAMKQRKVKRIMDVAKGKARVA